MLELISYRHRLIKFSVSVRIVSLESEMSTAAENLKHSNEL
jgi:hypothetical protein